MSTGPNVKTDSKGDTPKEAKVEGSPKE